MVRRRSCAVSNHEGHRRACILRDAAKAPLLRMRIAFLAVSPPMPKAPPLRLGVNVDHVATLRNARAGLRPDPVRAAIAAIEAGADSITAHLREDRRHIRDEDMTRLK